VSRGGALRSLGGLGLCVEPRRSFAYVAVGGVEAGTQRREIGSAAGRGRAEPGVVLCRSVDEACTAGRQHVSQRAQAPGALSQDLGVGCRHDRVDDAGDARPEAIAQRS
jgi:hypothetical protein